MLKKPVATNLLAYEGETFSKQVIQVDVDLKLVNNIHVMHEPQEEPCVDIEIDHGPKVSSGVHDYILVHDICRTLENENTA